MKTLRILLLAAVAAVPTQAFGWGSTGHRIIGVLAARNLPADLPPFLSTPEAIWQIGELAREPDRWRGSGPAHDNERDPGHFVDVADDLTVAEGPALSALPDTRQDYDSALRKVGSNQYKAGYLPYSIIDGWQQLRTDFAYWRADVAGQKFAKTDDERAWFANDQKLREALAVRDLGVWAHFVGDASQPMHASVHYDGWGDFPNPNGFTTLKGTHMHFEGPFVRANVSEADVAAQMTPYVDCACSIEAHTADYLAATAATVVPFYTLEKAHAFDTATPEGKAFATARVAAGADMLRDMIVDAWKASGDAKIGYPAVAVKDVEAGTADAFGPLQGED
jgi:hypothetical protein